jgi:transcriptional regulator with XRE-family HTH domain
MKAVPRKPRKKKSDALPPPQWAVRLCMAFVSAGLEKKDVAKQLGVVPKTVESWMTGRTEPHFTRLVKLSEITGVSLDWILKGEGQPILTAGSRGNASFG